MNRRSYIILAVTGMLIHGFLTCNSQTTVPPYKNASLSVDVRVNDLISRMTPTEKFRQLFMIPGDLSIGKEQLQPGIFGFCVPAQGATADANSQLVKTGPIGAPGRMAELVNETQRFFISETRLGIPVIQFDEALHGLVRDGATAFPQSIALAATFNTDLMHRVARAIAAETKSRGIRQVLSPVLNIARDVRWGRTEETYGEDPHLVSRMGSAFISEFERSGIITTPKHFAVNSGDGGRDSYPVHYGDRILEEIYFPAFHAAIKEAGAHSVMTAYNSLDGRPCTSSTWLLNSKLKQEWGFRGFVISDACAVGGANVLHFTASGYEDAGKQAIENGLDVIFQTDFSHAELFEKPFLSGGIRQGSIDSAVRRVLQAKFELGLFENPYADPGEANRINGAAAHRKTALQAARESIVLLKNETSLLPLKPGVKKIAVLGSDAAEARLGGYSGKGNNKISILDGITQFAADSIEVMYHPGCPRTEQKYVAIPAEYLFHESDAGEVPGLLANYFDNIDLAGDPRLSRTDPMVDFNWTLYGPDPSLRNDWYSVSWNGMIKADTTGTIRLGVEGNDGYRLFLNEELLIDNWNKRSFNTILKEVSFQKGALYSIRLEYFECTGNARVKLIWNAWVADSTEEVMQIAGYLAEQSDLVIVAAGIEEGEFRDRSSLRLPGRQEELINKAASAGKPVVVLLVGGSAITMEDWMQNADAILDVWYPGEAGGLAVAEVLFGQYNPAGRLPITFPVSEGQLPLVYNHKPTGRGDDYLDLSGAPLFPFGFGLSYTSFTYSKLRFDKNTMKAADSGTVSFQVKNTGKLEGDEVCQLYIRDELASVARPVMELKGFVRVKLLPGETKNLSFTINPGMLMMLDENMRPVLEPGNFRIMIGASSRDIRLSGVLKVE